MTAVMVMTVVAVMTTVTGIRHTFSFDYRVTYLYRMLRNVRTR